MFYQGFILQTTLMFFVLMALFNPLLKNWSTFSNAEKIEELHYDLFQSISFH